MKLDEIVKPTKIKVESITEEGLSNDAFRFGIEPGKILDVVNVIPGGPIVVQLGEQQVAIGRELARCIDIEISE